MSDKLDIDLLVKFKTVRWSLFGAPGVWDTPESALDKIQRVLVADQTYRIMRPKPDAPTVSLTYADHFTFEIVPALVDKTGRYNHQPGEPDCYLVGLQRDTWSPADYDYEAAYISSLNKQTGGRLVPSIKLIKAFLRGHGLSPDPLKSFHIEILCARIIPPVIASWEAYGLTWGYHHTTAALSHHSYLKYSVLPVFNWLRAHCRDVTSLDRQSLHGSQPRVSHCVSKSGVVWALNLIVPW